MGLKELKERQKQQLRQKAMKKGLDPEALTGKYPPKIRLYSKYERRTDTRTYEDRRKLYEGGWEVVRAEHLQALWKEKYEEWLKRPKTKLPSGSARDPARNPETQSLPTMKRRVVLRLLLKRRRKRKRRKKKRRRKSKRNFQSLIPNYSTLLDNDLAKWISEPELFRFDVILL